METVSVNGLTLCHKNSSGFTRSTLPDMCRSPKVPVPYTNTAYARDLVRGTITVRSHGGAMNGIKGSRFAVSFGDEPGIGLGVKSGTVHAEATWLSWSPNVFMEGRPATRLTDKMLMNHGNTISAGGYKTDKIKGERKKFLDQLCTWACECKDEERKQLCVGKKIMEEYYKGQYPKDYGNGICREVSMQYDSAKEAWKIIMNGGSRGGPPAGTVPTSNPYTPTGGIRPDAYCQTPGEGKMLVEMKFKGDKPNDNQITKYPEAADDLDADYKIIDVEKDCDCPDGGGSAPAPVTVPSKAPEQKPSQPWSLPKFNFPALPVCKPYAYTLLGTIWECKFP